MIEIKGRNVEVFDFELNLRERENRDYLLSLTNANLLFNYNVESGRYAERDIPEDAHGGWETPVCQLRGHFLGHWLSAASFNAYKTGDKELKAKAETLVDELFICQKENGGKWIGPVPEKYLHWLEIGKPVWAPQYNLHKILMGLVDVKKFLNYDKAVEVADNFADWFIEWTNKFSREEFDNILDVETGGMLEAWGDLLEITSDEKYNTLIERYYRSRLFQPLLEGKDPLSNMHANTTIPEILGCARIYEVTKDKKWLDIVEAYWKCAVTDRGTLVTGGQTSGEVWIPKESYKSRLGDKNQEFCTVYNMNRLAEFMFRVSKDPAYMQYIEYNLYNGIMAQSYYNQYDFNITNGNEKIIPTTGLLTYFMPMKAGLKKEWSTKTNSFFCCHGTMIQGNAAFNRSMYYADEEVYVCQYFSSVVDYRVGEKEVRLLQIEDTMSGSTMNSSNTSGEHSINDVTSQHVSMPQYKKMVFTMEKEVEVVVNFRIPEWTEDAVIYVNDEVYSKPESSTFVRIDRKWYVGDKVTVILPKVFKFISLPFDDSMGAFRYGPDVLAGICEKEMILNSNDIENELEFENEREWGVWKYYFKTKNQNPCIEFRRLRNIGYEPYQIYFKVKEIRN